MFAESRLHTNRNSKMATAGTPTVRQRVRRTTGAAGRRRARTGSVAAVLAAGCAFTAASDSAAPSRVTTLFADDIATLHLLVALQTDRELREVRVRLASVVLDAVDELLR